MSLRATTGSVDNYGRLHEFDIHQQGYSGPVAELKNTGEGYARFDHQVIDPRELPPIQKGALELSVWLRAGETGILDDLKGSDEREFWIVHKIDGDTEWMGWVYMDLSSYEENVAPYRLTLLAKDFTDLEGQDYLVSGSLPDDREAVITTICYLLSRMGFDLPVITSTSWIEEHINAGQDYLRQIYHETRALRKFGNSEAEPDEPISMYEALERLCQNHRLILKQAGGAFRLDQITAYDDPESVQQADYDLSGDLQSEGNRDTTTAGKVVLAQNNRDNSGLPGLKRATARFDHRATVSGLQLPELIYLTPGDPAFQATDVFSSSGDTRLSLNATITANFQTQPSSASVQVVLSAHGMSWDETSGQWVQGFYSNTIDLPHYHAEEWIGTLAFNTGPLPIGLGPVQVTLAPAVGPGVENPIDADETTYYNVSFGIIDPSVPEGTSAAIDYQLTQSGGYSASHDLPSTWYGDGPNAAAVSALRYGPGDNDITMGGWQRRGGSGGRLFHENLLKEALDPQRGWRRLLSALIKSPYKPHQVLSYDGAHLYYLGGSQDIFTGDWTVNLLLIKTETGSDEFSEIPRYERSGSSSGGSGGSGGGTASWNRITGKPSGPGQWASETGFDSRYLRQSMNLSDLDSPAAARGNLGLGDLAVLDRVDTDQIVDGAVTNAKLEHSTISGVALGDDLFSLLPGDGIAGDSYNGGATRTWSIDYTDPLRIEDGALGIYDHGEGQRGVLSPDEQDIFGAKRFQDEIILNDRMVTDDYVARLRGMLLTSEGLADLRSLFVDELVSKTFISDTTLSLASSTYTTKSMSTLAGSVELPTQGVDFLNFMTGAQAKFAETARAIELSGDYETNRFILPVEPHDTVGGLSNALVFEEGDYIRLRAIDRTGGMRMINLWGTVTYPVEGDPSSVERADGVQEFVFQLLHPSSIDVPIAINAGSVILDYGKPGDAVMERSALGDDGPFDRQFTWTGVPWDTSQYSVLTHIGNLESSPAGFSGAGAYLRDNVLIESANGDFRAGKNADGQGHFGIYLDEDNYWLLGRGFSVKAVTDEMDGIQSSIVALQNEIDLRVETDDVINSINLSEEGIRISGNRLHVTSATTFDSDVTIKGVLDGVKGTFSGELSAASGSFGDVSVGVGGRISLPPSWSGDERTGYLDRRGLNLLWVSQEGGDHPGAGLSQEISWYTGLAGYSGRIRPSGTGSGILHISSDFGLTLDTAAGKHIAIRPGDFGSIRMTRIGRSNGRTGGYSAGAGLVIDPDVYIAVITEVTGSPWYTFTYSGTTPSQGDTKIVYNDTSNDISASGTTVANGFTRNFSLRAKEYVKLVRIGSSWSPPAT